MRKTLFIYLCINLLWISFLRAETFDPDIITLYSSVCEAIRPEESTSSTRMRATDKACFKALENIGDLSSYRSQYDDHKYNLLIYKLVDTYLEDLTTRTTSQNELKVCVEITGFLNKNNISSAAAELAETQQEAYPEKLEIEKEALTMPSPNGLPPKPEIKIDEKVAIEQAEIADLPSSVSKAQDNTKTKIFIESTKFFNNTSTNAFQHNIAQVLEERPDIIITTGTNDADYIIKTKVLRAKVDPINKQTNRLQMVIAIELQSTKDDFKLLEHQNRFILFENSEDEQSVASGLLKKLLKKATSQILPKIKNLTYDSGAIITPPKI